MVLKNLTSLACVYMLGLSCGIWSKEEVIAWCDKVIEVKDFPPYEIIEVSLMSNAKVDDIEGKLHEFCQRREDDHSVMILLGVLYEKIKRDQIGIEQATRCSTRLLVQSGLYIEEEYYNLYGIDDSLDLAKNGVYGDLDDVETAYFEEISVFGNYFVEFNQMYVTEIHEDWVS